MFKISNDCKLGTDNQLGIPFVANKEAYLYIDLIILKFMRHEFNTSNE